MNEEFAKWALTQGGLTVVIVILLWSYRRDLARIQAKDQEKTDILIVLVRDVTAALHDLKSAVTTMVGRRTDG